jgi:PAS domain S-box-containing protein
MHYPTFLATGHMPGVEYEFVSATGVQRRIRVTANALRDAQGNFLMTRSVLHDFTELAQARRELALLNAEQQAMLDNELIGIVKTRDLQIRWANRGMHRLFGYPEGALVGHPVRVLHGDERSYVMAGRRLAAALARGSCLRMRFDLVRRDGRTLPVDATGSRVPGDGGDHLWIFSEATDGSQQTPVHQGVLDAPGSGG